MCLGIPGQIVEIIDPAQQRATVDVEGVRREISIALLTMEGGEGVDLGDWVLIHVGFAMAKIDEQEATDTLNALRMLGDPYNQELADFSFSAEDELAPREAIP